MMGEAEAYHLGISVQRIKRATILLVALATGASVAAAGVIGFVGIVVPHMLRLVVGLGSSRALLPLCGSRGRGAVLLRGADIVARTVVAPAELPIGIVTAAIGAPFFLSWLLLRPTRSLVRDYERADRSKRARRCTDARRSGKRRCLDARLAVARGRGGRDASRWSGRTAPANRRCCACCRASSSPRPARSR